MAIPTYLRELHSSLGSRLRPEDVLAIIVRGRPSALPEKWRVAFREAIWGRSGYYSTWSSMSSDFARPVGAERQLASLVKATGWKIEADAGNPQSLAGVVELVGNTLGGNGRRLDREQRKAEGVDLSRRKYNRQWRAMRRLHHKTNKLATEIQKHEMQLIGRSGFASKITLERFAADPAAAHFIAYWVARKNLRRQFSLEGKQNPMDEVATWFLSACVSSETTDWMLIALACPNPGILNKLSDREQGWLLAEWFSVLRTCAGVLKQAWPTDVDKRTMIVRRGHDSSTWNTMAQAYNTARASWLACIAAWGAECMLDAACPGKVMRLMAADLAYWHRSTSGSEADPNSEVWANLPMPWDVLSGEVECTRQQVEGVCRIIGLNPRDSGWTAPRPAGEPVPFSVTPELVHGVTVASPEWAMLLRRAGVFSGKKLTDDYQLHAEVEHGLAGGVVVSDLPSRPLVE
jgi:hypothetical protein